MNSFDISNDCNLSPTLPQQNSNKFGTTNDKTTINNNLSEQSNFSFKIIITFLICFLILFNIINRYLSR